MNTGVNNTTYTHAHQYDFQVRCTVTDATGYAVTSGNYYVNVGNGLGKKQLKQENLTALPSHYALEEAYPNPFNPSTTLELALPKAAHVRMAIFDLVGREVSRLANGVYEAGYHNFRWNAQGLASGVYFVRVEVTDGPGKILLQTTHKLLLTK